MRRLIYLVAGTVAFAAFASAPVATGSAQHNPNGGAHGKKIAICHRTSSDTKPYVRIRVSVRAVLQRHRHHAADIIPAPAEGCPKTRLSPTDGGTALNATLTGAAEVPGPGDPDGSGTATIRLRGGQGQICFQLNVTAITLPATAAHIHTGASGVAGAAVVTLTPPDASGNAAGCVNARRTLVAAILANPAGYYVNVHTTDFPDGAVRGQLAV